MSDAASGLRRGITPVIAIVLLLMMTVAAAGAAFTWFNQIQGSVQEQAESELQTSFKVRDLQCDAANENIVLSIQNSGSQSISGSQVDVFVYDSEDNLNVTRTGLDWSDEGFTDAGGFDQVTVDVSQSGTGTDFLSTGAFYRVEVSFSNVGRNGITVDAGTCIAES